MLFLLLLLANKLTLTFLQFCFDGFIKKGIVFVLFLFYTHFIMNKVRYLQVLAFTRPIQPDMGVRWPNEQVKAILFRRISPCLNMRRELCLNIFFAFYMDNTRKIHFKLWHFVFFSMFSFLFIFFYFNFGGKVFRPFSATSPGYKTKTKHFDKKSFLRWFI